MKNLDIILSMLVPASLVLVAMFLVVKSFITKEITTIEKQLKINNNEKILPMRLQAYERIIMFLERLNPASMILRLSEPGDNVAILQHKLVHNIREEYNHNISQQLYIGGDAWVHVKNAVEETLGEVNAAAQQLNPEDKGMELGKAIINSFATKEVDPASKAIAVIKIEAQKLF